MAAPFYQPQGNEVALHRTLAHRLGRPLIKVACNEDMTASDLVGRYLLDAGVVRGGKTGH